MKVLVVGSGGREHAIVKALNLSPSVSEVHVVPGNPGMAVEALCHSEVDTEDFAGLVSLIRRNDLDFVVVGPEGPLAAGLSDALREAGILVFGPSCAGAQLEASKIFAKIFMRDANIPTAHFTEVGSVDEVLRAVSDEQPPFVLKADGLAAGKGVFICQSLVEVEEAAHNIFEKKILGEAGRSAIVERFQKGWELSYLILTNGQSWEALPLAQDHKRLRDGDQGPNTGGMGVIAPIAIGPELNERIERTVLRPIMDGLRAREVLYRGVLYVGLMVTEDGPQVLEFNARFGDPEAQVILPLLDGDWGEVMLKVAQGELPQLKWKPLYSACVVLAAESYPESPVKNVVIGGDVSGSTPSSYFIHAGTGRNPRGQWITQGGRVLNSVGLGSTLQEAVANAYRQAEFVRWPGLQMRRDIGEKIL